MQTGQFDRYTHLPATIVPSTFVSRICSALTVSTSRSTSAKSADLPGSIEPGKAADFALVDRDVLTVSAEQMRDTKVLATMVAGEWVYRSN